ncbi:nSTAND1 domain-containing NTPase [Microbacterium trichothecenolyticum]
MVVKVLGPLETGAGPLSPRERAMLSALVVRRGTTVSPSELADAWWGEAAPRTWEQQVRNAVGRIRSRLGSHSIETVGVTYRLGIDADSIDAVQFERLASTARAHALRGEHERAIDAYRRALALWRGEPLPDVAGWEPGIVEALRLDEIRESIEEELLEARLAAGEHRSLLPDAERLLREQPLREDRWAIVALANYRADRQAEALAVLRAARERLAEELGIEPGARLAELEVAILRRDPALAAPPSAPAAAAACPYPGLRPFGAEDSDVFFGREDDTEAILERLAAGSVVTIAGASGTGKSSLLLAGVLPRLQERGRLIEVVRPGSDGAAAVQRASAHAHVLAVDQAEELLAASSDAASSFSLLAHEFVASGGALLVTVRSDALDRLRALPGLGDDVGRSVYLLGGLTDASYRSAIEEPARRSGLHLEPGLVELAVRDAGDRSSTLPHLSHALQQTWLRREGTTLTVAGYRAAGGIPGAIAQSAEEAFQSLSPEEQDLCRSLMLRLVDRGADGASTRRRVAAAPLLADAPRRRVLERLAKARLVTIDEDAVAIAHESVAIAWPRLDGWLEDDANGARTLRAVETAAAAWDAAGRADDDLLRGARLHSALAWRDAAHPDLTAVEADLLDTSAAREEESIRELSDSAARERSRGRVLAMSLVGAAILLVTAVVAGALAGLRGQEAAAAAENAKVEAVVATSLSLRASDREGAALLAAEAYRRWPDDPRVRSALLGTMTSASGLLDAHATPGAYRTTMTAIPGTGTALRVRDGEAGTALEIVDAASGDVVRELDVDLVVEDRWLSDYRDVKVSADGRVGLVQSGTFVDPDDRGSCCWNQLTFVDLSSGEQLPGSRLLEMRTSVDVDLGEDGSVAYFQHPITGDAMSVDTRSGDVRTSGPDAFGDFTGEGGIYNAVAVVDSGRVAVGVHDRVDVFDRASLALIRSIELPGEMGGYSLTPDDTGGLLTSGPEGRARVRADSGDTVWSLPTADADPCWLLERLPNGTILCSDVGTVSVLDPETGRPSGPSLATQNPGHVLVSAIDDDTVLLDDGFNARWMRWRLDGSSAGAELIAPARQILEPPAEDGRYMVTVPIGGGPAQLWDLQTDAATGDEADGITLLGNDVAEVYSEAQHELWLVNIRTGQRYQYDDGASPADLWLLTARWGPHVFVASSEQIMAVDPVTGKKVGATLRIDDNEFAYIGSVSQSADGEIVVVNWLDQGIGRSQVGVFRLSDGRVLARGLFDHDRTIILPDGDLISVMARGIQRVDAATLEPVSTLSRSSASSNVLMASVDGRTLLNVGFDNRLQLFDLTRDIPLGDAIDMSAYDQGPGGFLAADGTRLLTNGPAGVMSWDLRPAEQARAACAIAGRELTEEEWDTYFAGDDRVATCAALADAPH